MKARIEIKDNGYAKLLAEIKKTQPGVKVGVLGSDASKTRGKVTNADLAQWFESGTRDHFPKKKGVKASADKRVKKAKAKSFSLKRFAKRSLKQLQVKQDRNILRAMRRNNPNYRKEKPKPMKGMPPRKWLTGYISQNQSRIRKMLHVGGEAIIQGKETAETFFPKLGLQIVGEIQQRISQGIAPPNSPVTIKQKKSSKPLIDSSEWRKSISSAMAYRDQVKDK